jgi:hypothetical protein
VLLGEEHLRTVIREYIAHYHIERNHQGIGNVLIHPPARPSSTTGTVVRRKRKEVHGCYCHFITLSSFRKRLKEVMTAGGIDMLGGRTNETGFNEIARGLTTLWTEMAKDGVQDVVYFGYTRSTRNDQPVNLYNTIMSKACAEAPLRCYFIDGDVLIDRKTADGIHPTAEGSRALGAAAYQLMVESGMRR